WVEQSPDYVSVIDQSVEATARLVVADRLIAPFELSKQSKLIIGQLRHKGLRWSRSASLIGRLGSSTFRLSTNSSVDVAHGLALLFGLGTKALPSWDSKTRWNNLMGDLAVTVTAGSSRHTNSPHPSSREGHHSTVGWISGLLLFDLILSVSHAPVTSLVHPKSVPSTQMRCMITATRPASATIAFFIPRCLAIFIAQALSQDHFVERTSMLCAAS